MTLNLPNVQVSNEVETWPAFDVEQAALYSLVEITSPPPLPAYAKRRRAGFCDLLDSFEEVTRYRFRMMSDSQGDAVWAAVWQLRKDVIGALDRCEAGERAARWVQDE